MQAKNSIDNSPPPPPTPPPTQESRSSTCQFCLFVFPVKHMELSLALIDLQSSPASPAPSTSFPQSTDFPHNSYANASFHAWLQAIDCFARSISKDVSTSFNDGLLNYWSRPRLSSSVDLYISSTERPCDPTQSISEAAGTQTTIETLEGGRKRGRPARRR